MKKSNTSNVEVGGNMNPEDAGTVGKIYASAALIGVSLTGMAALIFAIAYALK